MHGAIILTVILKERYSLGPMLNMTAYHSPGVTAQITAPPPDRIPGYSLDYTLGKPYSLGAPRLNPRV